MNDVRLVYENGVPNIQKKLWYTDDNSEINLANFEAGDRIYSINDDELYQVEYDTSTEQEYSGAIVSFEADEDDRISSLEIEINPVQDLHGQDAPYPAGGGKNLLNPSLLTEQASWQIVNLSLPDGTYTMSTNSDDSTLPIYFLRSNETQATGNKVTASHPVTRALEDGYTLQVIFRRVSGENTFSMYQYQIESGSSATAYSPYSNECPISGWTGLSLSHSGADTSNPTVIPISWETEAGTVYGGSVVYNGNGTWTINADQGIFTVTKAQLDAFGDGWYGWHSDWGAWCRNLNYYNNVDRTYHNANQGYRNLCNAAICVVNNSSINASQRRTSFKSDGWSSYQDFYNAVVALEAAGTPMSYVADFNEKLTYTVTTEEFTTLLGQNNIWADTGDTTIKLVTNNKTLFTLNPHS